MSVSTDFIKPLVSGAVATVLDKVYLKEQNLQSSLIFGASVAVGEYVGIMAGGFVPDMNLPVLGNGKGLGQRIVEIGAGAGSAYAVHTYVFKNSSYRDDMFQVLGVCAVADIAGELVGDYLAGRPLAVLS